MERLKRGEKWERHLCVLECFLLDEDNEITKIYVDCIYAYLCLIHV